MQQKSATLSEIRCWRALTKKQRQARLGSLTDTQLKLLAFNTINGGPPVNDRPNSPWWTTAREEQIPPESLWQDKLIWAVIAGRGWGKTRTGSEWVRGKVHEYPGLPGALVAKDPGEARDVMIEGISGVLAISPPDDRPIYEPSKKRISWANGTTAGIFSSEEFEELRGPQHAWVWADELPKWRNAEKTWEQILFGLRIGPRPTVCVTSTPRPVKVLKELLASRLTHITRGTTYDNLGNLSPIYQEIIKKYEGTRLGRQELDAVMLDDVPGALWTYAMLDRNRVIGIPGGVQPVRVAVGVDPSASEDGAEAGIIVGMKGSDGHGYVLKDSTLRGRPEAWAKAAVDALEYFKGDRIIAEANNGGQMVEAVIKGYRRNTPVRLVHAARAKIPRAEPISLLYERGLIHHVGTFGELEDQMCQYDIGNPESLRNSPDRMDALVWLMTDLMGRGTVSLSSAGATDGRERPEYESLLDRMQREGEELGVTHGELTSARPEFEW